MKNFAKFIPVALGLLTLASCSSDDLFGDKTQFAEEAQPGDLVVTMEGLQEEGSVFTRSFIDATTNTATRKYVPLDELRVYDNDLHKYDIYAFTWTHESENQGRFRRKNTDPNITEPKWAIYPKADVVNGSWTYNEVTNMSRTEVTMNIPTDMEYDATYSVTDTKFETPLYKDVLPRWGSVSSINNGDQLIASLKYMTGVLRLKLAGIPDYAQYVLVKMLVGGLESNQVVMTGPFTAAIARGDNPDPNAMLTMQATKAQWGSETGIKVAMKAPDDLVGMAKSHAVVYVPLVTTVDPTTGNETFVDIVVYAPTETSTYDAGRKEDWKEIKRFTNKKIERAKLYGNKSELNLAVDGDDVNSINDALELSEPDEETIVLEATNADGIEVCAGGNNTIKIPNKAGVKNIIIDLSKGVFGCATGTTLYIQDKNPGDRFAGNVMLIGAKKSGKAAIQLNVQLPSAAGFAFAGDAVAATGGSDVCFTIDAKSFTLGDGKTATSYKDIRFDMSENVETVNVAEQANFNSGIVVSPTAFKAVKAINVNNGVIAGNAGTPNVAIDASAALNAVDITATGDNAEITGNIITKGAVTITSKMATFEDITADGAITISGEAVAKHLVSNESTITLTGKANSTETATAKGNISISENAFVLWAITSEEGDIVINNAFDAAQTYKGAITATLGSVNLNEVGDKVSTFSSAINAGTDVIISGNVVTSSTINAGQDVKLSGKAEAKQTITAGRDFSVIEEAFANCDVNLKRAATVNITRNDGDAVAVAGALTFATGADYALNLLSGVVNSVTNADGEVALTFATTPAFAAIGLVTVPDNLKPTNASVWNGKPLTVDAAYWIDDTRIWTASQLGMQQGDAGAGTVIDIRSNIDLNNEEWAGINAAGAYTITGNYKTISKVKAMGQKATKTAGFFNYAGGKLEISGLTFDGVQTDITVISGGVYDGGIGGVVGLAYDAVNLTRVIVKLAGTNFGCDGVDNVQTANVGGLIGLAKGEVTFTGVQVDATGTKLTGYKNMGGFIGKTENKTTIKMAEKDGSDPMVKPTVTGLEFFVTFDATEGGFEVNDPYQGSTGAFIGAIHLGYKLEVSDVADVKPTIVAGGKANEGKAFKIEDTTHRFFFKRDADNADQTLVGNSGYDITGAAQFKINNRVYQIYKTGYAFIVGSPKLYSLINEAHVD
jgi:hypothetical protein